MSTAAVVFHRRPDANDASSTGGDPARTPGDDKTYQVFTTVGTANFTVS